MKDKEKYQLGLSDTAWGVVILLVVAFLCYPVGTFLGHHMGPYYTDSQVAVSQERPPMVSGQKLAMASDMAKRAAARLEAYNAKNKEFQEQMALAKDSPTPADQVRLEAMSLDLKIAKGAYNTLAEEYNAWQSGAAIQQAAEATKVVLPPPFKIIP